MLPSRIESYRNLSATWLRNGLLMLATLALSFTATMLTINDVNEVSALHRAQAAQGADVLLITSTGAEGLDATQCEALSHLDGVVTSGSILDSAPAIADTSAGTPLQLTTVTAGLLPAIYTMWQPVTGLVFTTDATATEFGWVAGSEMSIDGHVTTLDAMLPEYSTRGEGTGTVWFVQAPYGSMRECYARVQIGRASEMLSVIQAHVGDEGHVEAVTYFDNALTPQQELDNRLSRWGWVAVGVIVLIVHVFSLLSRRKDLALYRLLGFPARWLGRMLLTDLTGTVILPTIYGVCLAVAFGYSHIDNTVMTALTYDTLSLLSALILVCGLLTIVFTPRQPLNAIKES